MQITKFTTTQNNHASSFMNTKILQLKSQNKLKQLNPGLVAIYNLWPGNKKVAYSQRKR